MAVVRSLVLDRLRERLRQLGGTHTLVANLPAAEADVYEFQKDAGRDALAVTPYLKAACARALRRAVESGADARGVSVWDTVAEEARRVVAARFAANGGDAKWAPISAAYAAWKASTGRGHLVLVAEGRLRAALAAPGSIKVEKT